VTKTILICANVYPPNFIGGAELIAHYQAKLLTERGYKVIIFAGEMDGGARYSVRQDYYDGLPVFRVRLHPEDYSSDFVNFSNPVIDAHFKNFLDAFSPDVVHMHNIIGLSAGIVHAAKRKGIKTVLTLHDHWGFCYKNTLIKNNEICQDYSRCVECLRFINDGAEKNIPIRMRRDFLMLRLSEVDIFISPSLYLAETYVRAGIPIEKVKVIWNGIDVAKYSAFIKRQRSGKIRFTFIGRFGLHKGIHVILDALDLIRVRDQVQVNLVGTGELTAALQERVQKSGLPVRFWGMVDNGRIEEVFRETDVLILPSIWPENQPVTITEAMASRTPVIASAIGGIPELVSNDYNGYLFRPGSAVELAEKMSEFVARPERIEHFGENGFQRIKDNSFEHQVDKICTIYE
jgi:glycosyltransferase involved in cell wall biosynthesis